MGKEKREDDPSVPVSGKEPEEHEPRQGIDEQRKLSAALRAVADIKVQIQDS